MCKFRTVRLKEDLKTLFIKVLLDLNYVNMWYLMSSINFVCAHTWFATIIWIDELFNDWNKCVVMWFMLECCWNEFLVLKYWLEYDCVCVWKYDMWI